MPHQTRVVGYVRVSTTGQAENGISLETQAAKIREYAKVYDLNVIEVIEDAGESGKHLNRPGLHRALAILKRGDADALVVAKLDRLTRRVVNLGELVERYFTSDKWALLSVAEQIDTRSASGRLVLNVLTSVAQWEREAIAERTSAALRHKASRGEFTGGEPPYGYRLARDGQHLEPDETEQPTLGEALRLRAANLSLRAVAKALYAKGMVSRTGKAFAPTQVARMLMYAAQCTSNGPRPSPRGRTP